MNGNRRNYSLSLWDHNDNFICLLKSSNSDFDGQSYEENLTRNINGEETLTLSLPMYIFNKDSQTFEENIRWTKIRNENKIRYVEYSSILNIPTNTKEFVLKTFEESRNGEEKIARCTCESLAVYELGKVGWGISFNEDYISKYELGFKEKNGKKISNCPNLLTLDYWLDKIFYWETNLGRVSTPEECTKMLQGLQLRNEDGNPIADSCTVDSKGNNEFNIIDEPKCDSDNEMEQSGLMNLTGWHWTVSALTKDDPSNVSTTTVLYEDPSVNRYIEITPNNFVAQSYQSTADGVISLRRHPIEEKDYGTYKYVTQVKKHLINVERSNIFSIIQDLCEAFEVWAIFNYTYDNSGKIIDREILFKTEAINEDIKFDFAYGKNLETCSRNINSNELVTKLIIPDTESTLNDGQLLSIRQAAGNPTGENYLYNFDYFYDIGSLSRLTNDELNGNGKDDGKGSSEYKINLYSGKLKNINNKISNLQSYLVPLYNRKIELEGNLAIKKGEITGYMDNIQSLQNKVDAIPPEQTIIRSWSDDVNVYNHVGDTRTFSQTTYPNTSIQCKYLDFHREDVICDKDIIVTPYSVDKNGEVIESKTTSSFSSFIPRAFVYGEWYSTSTTKPLGEDSTNFISFTSGASTTINNEDPNKKITVSFTTVEYNYSDLGDNQFIKGIYFNFESGKSGPISNYARVRYKYFPLAYYYLLMKDYWNKINQTKEQKKEIEKDLQEINNRIITQELKLNVLLNDKKRLILQFEKDFKPYIREGYWDTSNYQAQIDTESLDTRKTTSIYEGFISVNTPLNQLKLNDSLHTYSYYFDLGKASDIDIDSITMKTWGRQDSVSTMIPRYRGNDFELYRGGTVDDGDRLIVAISPSLIDYYILNKYEAEDYKSKITYNTNTSTKTESTTTISWTTVTDNVRVVDSYIYLSNDNLITNELTVYGYENDESSSTTLKMFEDFTYDFDYAGYDEHGNRVPLNEQQSYSTDIYYDYFTKITLKLTNLNNRILDNAISTETVPHYVVNYTKETTLDYLMNDATATSKKYAKPQITYNIGVVDLSSLNGYENYKPVLGQKVPIWDIEMGFKGIEGFITSISKNLENPENTQIEIATYKTKFEDIFQKLTATMTDVRYNENSIYKAAESFNTDGTIKTQVFRKALEDNLDRINFGVNNDITINERDGILLSDRENGRVVKLIGNGIFLSEDGTNWKTGITGKGINSSVLTSGEIDTKEILIYNSSEDQIRFRWNNEGLKAYGDKFGEDESSVSTSTQNLIDYHKFVLFNQHGLKFEDNKRSALSLGWDGLKISAQNGALNLDANRGLVLQEYNGVGTGSATTRLELGKLDSNLYGLRLHDPNGIVTFQNDSGGDLWLQRHIRVGGSMSTDNSVEGANAGIYGGSKNNTPIEMQMGIRRNDKGEVIWDSAPIRFWAGPQSKNSYTTNIHVTQNEIISATNGKNFNTLADNSSPSLAKFKVSENGDILASGIDVGGWIGQGDKLHSHNNEAILRSNGYSNIIPVFAIGATTSDPDIESGTNYNFKVFQDGRIDIGNGQFTASSTGAVVAKNITISSSNSAITGGTVGGLIIQNNGLEITSTTNNATYKTALYAYAGTTTKVLQMGLSSNEPDFYVTGQGALYAYSATIKGDITAESGTIGNFIIGDALHTKNKNSITSDIEGVYINGNKGISVGKGDPKDGGSGTILYKNGKIVTNNIDIQGGNIKIGNNFEVTNAGKVTIKSGSININNKNFYVKDNGDVSFKGTITAYDTSDKKDYTAINSTKFTIQNTGTQYTTFKVVRGLIVGVDR